MQWHRGVAKKRRASPPLARSTFAGSPAGLSNSLPPVFAVSSDIGRD
jgi:hypothetical protein